MKQPKTFPISLDDALRCWIPGVKEPDRWRQYRAFLQSAVELDNILSNIFQERGLSAPLPRTAESYLAEHKAEPLDTFRFQQLGDAFLKWRKSAISKMRSEAGRKGGNKSGGNKSSGKSRKSTRRKSKGKKKNH